MPVGQFGKLFASFFSHIYSTLYHCWRMQFKEASAAASNAVLSVFTTNSSPAVPRPEQFRKLTILGNKEQYLACTRAIGKLLDSFTSLGAHSI